MDDRYYTVDQVIPLPYSESKTANCVLVLTSGDRVFIEFKTRKNSVPSEAFIESKGLQADWQIDFEITGDWEVLALSKFPNVGLFRDRQLIDSVFSGFYRDHREGQDYTQNELPEKIVYSPFVGFQYTVGMDVFTLGRDRGNFELNKQINGIQQAMTETHSSIMIQSGQPKQILSKGRLNIFEEILEISPALPTGD